MSELTPVASGTAAPSSVPRQADTRLRGRRLNVARLGWIAAVLLTGAFYAITLPSYYTYLRVVTPAPCLHGCGPLVPLGPADVQTLHQLGLSVDAYAGYVIAVQLLILLGYGAVAAVLFWRASADRVALLASLTLLFFYTNNLYAINLFGFGLSSGSLPGWLVLLGEGLAFLGSVCIGIFFCVFPSGRFVPRWTPWLLLAWSAYQAYDVFFWNVPRAPLVRTPPDFAIWVCLTTGMVGAQVYRYRRVSTPTQRQQTKWAVLGTALAAGGYAAAFLVFVLMSPSVFPFSLLAEDVGYIASTLPTLLLPLGIGIAVLRYRLFDIDVIIRRTMLYGSLTAMLGALYFGVVVGVQTVAGSVDPQASASPVIIVGTTLLTTVLFTPLRRGLQAIIDRRFYRAKYDAARTLETFAATLRTKTDLGELSGQLMAVVRETMQPASVSLWLRESGKTPMDERTGGSE